MRRARIELKFTTSELTLAASLAAVYVVTTFIPVSPFIGGPGFISVEIVMLPLIAALLRPPLAATSIIAGSLGMALFGTSLYGSFGLAGLLVPILAVILGSFAFHYSFGFILPWAYVLAGAVFYLLFSKGGTLLWLLPYFLVIISPLTVLKASGTVKIVLLSFYTAMSEQVTLNVLSIFSGWVGSFWTIVTPFMFSERTLATVGGGLLIVALKSRLGARLETSLGTLGR